MACIVIADDGIPFDGKTPEEGPLGGAESAFVSLANAFAGRGHDVTAYTMTERDLVHGGVRWKPLSGGLPDGADLYIANRSDKLLSLVPNANARIFWIHNPAGYILKWRYLWKLFRWRPVIVFSGNFHATSCPGWVPEGGREIIPYGISEPYLKVERSGIAPPVSVFTSNPLRSLDWLLDIWAEKIHPEAPDAELHVYSGPATYGTFGAARADMMNVVLEKAQSLEGRGVKVLEPVAKSELARVYADARVMLYRGDPGETFCLAIGESQAVGVPAVVQDIGCVAERVIEGDTGFVASDDDDFAEKAVALLSDDALWSAQSRKALEAQRSWSWDHAAAAFEEMLAR